MFKSVVNLNTAFKHSIRYIRKCIKKQKTYQKIQKKIKNTVKRLPITVKTYSYRYLYTKIKKLFNAAKKVFISVNKKKPQKLALPNKRNLR